MEITKREILASVTILAVMVGIGVWLSAPILSKATERYLAVASSVVANTDDEFDYISRTNAGRFLANGTLSTTDTVRLEELSGVYSSVKKVKEEYRLHTEVYTTTDGKGHTTTHTRTYHSWDEVKHWNYKAERAMFRGKEFKIDEVYRVRTQKDTIIKVKTKMFENDTRYVYYTAPVSFDGIMIGNAMNRKYDGPKFINGLTSEQYIKNAERKLNGNTIAFWILWSLLTVGMIVGFYALENKWLY
jgi:hypothetical protein